MFPKIQRSRQARWPRVWRHAPVWAWASRSRCSFSPLDQSRWERCEESRQTASILPPDSPPCIPLITQPAGLHTRLNIPPSDTHPFGWFSHSLMASPATPVEIILPPLLFSPSPLISSPIIFIYLLSLSGLWDKCLVIFQWASIWKS